jgi:hypothetical protein
MRVEFTKDKRVGGTAYKAGQTRELREEHAREAIDSGAAKEAPAPEHKAGEEPTMLVRFRRPSTIGGRTYRAGSGREAVPQSEEAWAAVNRGDCDLDPPPGEAGQPFPPEELQADDSTDVPASPPPLVQTVAAVPAAAPRSRPARAEPVPEPAPAPGGTASTEAAKDAAQAGARAEGAKTPRQGGGK